MSAIIGFFILGIAVKTLCPQSQLPKGLAESLTLFLLIALGLKGGQALASHINYSLLTQSFWVILLGIIIPIIAYALLRYFGDFVSKDAASMAAHYGSISVGTYAAAIAYIESSNIQFEAYFPLFVVLLEVPAILIAILLYQRSNHAKSGLNKRLLSEVFLNQGVLILGGSILLGFFCHDSLQAFMPFFSDLFNGVLALFLFYMGTLVSKQLKAFGSNLAFLISFGVLMPLIGGGIGYILGHLAGLSGGGIFLLAVLGASASYIAAPAAMRQSLPQANNSLSLATSLGITFPFNVVIGIPIFANFIPNT